VAALAGPLLLGGLAGADADIAVGELVGRHRDTAPPLPTAACNAAVET
jgi:hypothetical protein